MSGTKFFTMRVLTFAVAYLTIVVSVVTGDYQLRARVHSYSNPGSKCAACIQSLSNPVYGCCDNHTNTGVCAGPERCDTFFRYCLRPLGQMGEDCPVRDLTAQDTAFFSLDNDDLADIGDLVLGTDNPLTITGPEWRGFQFYLESKDSDRYEEGGTQLIDSFAIDLSIQGGQRLEPREYQGRFGIAEIELSFELVCTDNYSLPDCSPCQPGSSEQCKDRRQNVEVGLVVTSPESSNMSCIMRGSTAVTLIVGVTMGTVTMSILTCTAILMVLLLRKKKRDLRREGLIALHCNTAYAVNTESKAAQSATTSEDIIYDYIE